MLFLISGVSIGGIPGLIIICITRLNPFQILFFNLFQPSSTFETCYLLIISSLMLLINAVYSVRYLAVVNFFMILLVDTYGKYWKGLQCKHEESNSFLLSNNNITSFTSKYIYSTYQKLFCLYVVYREFLLRYSVQAIFGSQIFITISFWVFFTGLGRLSPYVVLMFGSASFFLFVVIVGSFHFIAQYSITSNRIINGVKYSATRKSYTYLKWRAVRPLNIECGNHFHITKNSIAKYCEVLNSNLTNAIFLLPRWKTASHICLKMFDFVNLDICVFLLTFFRKMTWLIWL